MKILLSWLKNLIPLDTKVETLAETLTSIGIEVDDIEKLENNDALLHLSLTPNLVHAASVLGVARELASFYKTTFDFPDSAVKEDGKLKAKDFVSIVVEEKNLCPKYFGRVITDIKIAPSPAWLQKRLEAIGIRSINNVVDATNYALIELGHPLHAFDLDKIAGKKLVVRKAKSGEKITTLDGKERFPTEETLLICDAKNPQAVAGIMGGADSEVSEGTKTIVLESAYFEPVQVRRSSKRINLHTEGSYRFERGADPNMVLLALDRATKLIAELTGGKVAEGVVGSAFQEFPLKKISCRTERVNKILGTQFALSEIETILKQAGCVVTKRSGNTLEVAVPTYRVDLLEEIDLVEEIARLYGYNNIHNKNYRASFVASNLPHAPLYVFEKEVRLGCIKEGLQELLTCDLISPKEVELIDTASIPSRTIIKLLNPQSIDQSVLRPSLLPNLLRVVKYNLDHETQDIAGFEVGRVHFKTKDGYLEPSVCGIVLCGKRWPQSWASPSQKVDFYDLKGDIENLFASLHLPKASFEPSNYPNFHPGRQARLMIEGCEVGSLGQIHPQTARSCGIEEEVYFAEVNLEDLMSYVKKEIKMKPLPLYPGSTRDWTVTLKEGCLVQEVFDVIAASKSKILESVSLLDVYQNEKLGSYIKKATFRFFYRDQGRTIELKEIEEEQSRITQNVVEKLRTKVEG